MIDPPPPPQKPRPHVSDLGMQPQVFSPDDPGRNSELNLSRVRSLKEKAHLSILSFKPLSSWLSSILLFSWETMKYTSLKLTVYICSDDLSQPINPNSIFVRA